MLSGAFQGIDCRGYCGRLNSVGANFENYEYLRSEISQEVEGETVPEFLLRGRAYNYLV